VQRWYGKICAAMCAAECVTQASSGDVSRSIAGAVTAKGVYLESEALDCEMSGSISRSGCERIAGAPECGRRPRSPAAPEPVWLLCCAYPSGSAIAQ